MSTTHDPNRHHYPWLATREFIFTRTGFGKLQRLDPDEIGRTGGGDEPEGSDQGDTVDLPASAGWTFFAARGPMRS
jgi:hypothetical protein